MRRQPVIQPHGVGACGKGLGEGVFALVAGHQPGQRLAVARASLQQLVGQGDRLAILVQPHKHRHVLARTADAQVHAVDQPIQHMSEIQLAVHELVPHAGPGSLLDSVMVTPCFLSRPSAEAITTDAQSVSGMKPIFTSVFSGASVPAAQAPARTSGSTRDNRPAPVAARAAPRASCGVRHRRHRAGRVSGRVPNGHGVTTWAWLLAKRPARHGPDPVAGETSLSLAANARRSAWATAVGRHYPTSKRRANPRLPGRGPAQSP